jgi:hypothetical protein
MCVVELASILMRETTDHVYIIKNKKSHPQIVHVPPPPLQAEVPKSLRVALTFGGWISTSAIVCVGLSKAADQTSLSTMQTAMASTS